MKKYTNRFLALLVVFVMLLSMLPAVSFPAAAAGYVYNWGTREELCTELSDSAIAWYKAEGTSYEELSALSGSSSIASVPNSALYNELQDLMADAHSYKNSYDAVKTLAQYTDCENGGGKISSFYSGTAVGPSWNGSWNREHTWPNSKGLGGSDENDIMMIRPTSYSENSSRGNTAYGEGSSYYNPNKESGGKHDLRGDCARICLYVYVRWGNTSYMWGSSGVMESKDILLKWMEEDPVDTWEMGRNDSVESITGTRNVFVDYPELAFDLFEEALPDMDTPSGGTESYTITATSANTAYGTVSLSGKTITASPKTGYYASGYKVTSGSATVTQSGNTFTVNATSDCTVQIQFAPKTSVTVSFSGAGSIASQTGYAGEAMTLPTATAPEGFSFLGWTNTKLGSDTTEKPSYYTGTFYPTANTTLYALYSYTEGGTGKTEYVLTDIGNISATDEVVITMTYNDGIYALSSANGSSDGPSNQITVTASDNKLTTQPAETLLWNVTGSADSYSFNAVGTSNYLYLNSTNDGVRVGTSDNKTFKILSGYLFCNENSRYVGVYRNGSDWRCYTSIHSNISGGSLGFYVKGEAGTTYYTSNPTTCEHSNTTNVAAVAPTCTENGYTAGVYCNDCQSYISGHTVVEANGHHYDQGTVTAPTCTTGGYTTYTCSACGDSYVADLIEADGHDPETEITPATYTTAGSGKEYCPACNAIISTWEIPVLENPITNWNITLSGSIGVNFVTTLTDEEIVCTVAGNPVAVSLTEGKISISLAAAQMTDEIAFTVNGMPLASTYSVRSYADYILDESNGFSNKERALVKEMLNYGAASQNYFDYNTGNLANDDITVEAKTPTGEATLGMQGAVEGINFYGATLVHKDRIAVRFYFTAASIEGINFEVNDVAYTPVAKNGMYYIEVADINPQDLKADITVVVNDSLSISYAPMDYIIRMYSKASSSDATKALVQALYGYYLAAVAYTA